MEEVITLRDEGSKSIVKDDFSQYVLRAKELRNLIQGSITNLERYNDKLLGILGRLQGDKKDKEESIYVEMAQRRSLVLDRAISMSVKVSVLVLHSRFIVLILEFFTNVFCIC
uniref:IF rod domain-containing protein n=1 Tax=Syphacia muris TaxID=451379 RepID=A0A0N5B1N4_9BILA